MPVIMAKLLQNRKLRQEWGEGGRIKKISSFFFAYKNSCVSVDAHTNAHMCHTHVPHTCATRHHAWRKSLKHYSQTILTTLSAAGCVARTHIHFRLTLATCNMPHATFGSAVERKKCNLTTLDCAYFCIPKIHRAHTHR